MASSKIWVRSSGYTQQQLQFFFVNEGSFTVSFEDGACAKILTSDEGLLVLQEFFPTAMLSLDDESCKLLLQLPPTHLKENGGWAAEGFTFFIGKRKTQSIKGKEGLQ